MTPVSIERSSRLADSIIECASRHIKKYGYGRTTIDDITRDLTISKKTIYEIFPSKNDIVREIAWREMYSAVEMHCDINAPATDTASSLMNICRLIFNDRIKNGTDGIFWGIHHTEKVISEAYGEAIMRIMSKLYRDALSHGRVKQIPHGTAVRTIFSMILTACNSFPLTANPVGMFHDVLMMISDAITYKDRIPFDQIG